MGQQLSKCHSSGYPRIWLSIATTTTYIDDKDIQATDPYMVQNIRTVPIKD